MVRSCIYAIDYRLDIVCRKYLDFQECAAQSIAFGSLLAPIEMTIDKHLVTWAKG